MITVTLLRDTHGHIRAFMCRGHAGYAPRGSDIVCAAVSALVQSAVLGLTEVMHTRAAYRIDKGEVCCVVPALGSRERRQADAILETMCAGLRSMDKDYRKYLRMNEKEVDDDVFHELAAFCPQKGRRQLAKRS